MVVGAGLAGLACARTIQSAGRSVVLLEASDGVGGRVRTDVVEGFRLDRGFQVLLTAYPEVSRQLDVAALRLQRFDPGSLVWLGGKGRVVSDPFRDPRRVVSTATAPIGTLADRLRVARLRHRLLKADVPALLRGPDLPTIAALRARGFSETMIERFWRPLFAGIQLDPELATSNRMFDTIFRTLAEGDAAVPADGMGAIPAQLAAGLRPETVRLGQRVNQVDGTTVWTVDGGKVAARAVVVATEGPQAAKLLGLPPVASKPAGAAWFAADRPPFKHRLIALDGDGSGPVANVAVMSNVAPSYAPAGQALVVAALPGVDRGDLEAAARTQLTGWFGSQVDGWRCLRTYSIPHGQPGGAPPLHPKQRVSLGAGRFVCGDHRDTPSIQGALFSGRRCGEAVLSALP